MTCSPPFYICQPVTQAEYAPCRSQPKTGKHTTKHRPWWRNHKSLPSRRHSLELLTLTVSLLAFGYILATTPVHGLGRYLSPDVTATAMLVAIFGIRPLFADRFDSGPWYSKYLPTEDGQTTSLLVGMIAIACFAIGTAVIRQKTKPARILKRKKQVERLNRVKFTSGHLLAFTAIGAVAYIGALIVFAGSNIFGQLRNGRSTDVSIGGVPEFVMILPLTASIAAALFLLGRTNSKMRPSELLILTMAVGSSIVLVSQLGNRRFIIPAILIPIIAALMRRPTRVKLWHVIGGTAGLLFLAIIPMVRSAGARRPGESLLGASWRYLQEEGIIGVIRPIFVSYDTEMFDYIAVVGPKLAKEDYGLGRGTFVEFMTRPLPGSWGDTPAWSERLLIELFGGGCGDPVCPVASLPGLLYFEGGYIVVALGAFIAGAFLSALATKWRYNQTLSIRNQAYVAIISSFALIAVRTNTVHAAWWIIYTLLLVYLVHASAATMRKRPVRDQPFMSASPYAPCSRTSDQNLTYATFGRQFASLHAGEQGNFEPLKS